MALTQTRATLTEYARRAVHSGAVDDTATSRIQLGIENALLMISKDRKWSFLQDVVDIIAIAPYSTGTCTASGTTITGTLTVFPSNVVGQYFEFEGDKHWYEVTVRGGDTSLTIRQTYVATGATSSSYRIVYPLYALPTNFGWLNALVDVTAGDPLVECSFNNQHELHSLRGGTGQPSSYALVQKRHDSNVDQLFLYPSPSAERLYQLAYFRHPGWFDTATPATSSWKRTATADTDYVDWPDKYMDLLHDAIRACVAKEIRPELAQQYMGEYSMNMQKSANMERKNGVPRLLGRDQSASRGNVWSF